ncbi:MAG: F0F1 ATP synthase subunit gamma [Candidatus Sericytochromatia bacterium]|nr:F0F1 ATP synthase subunit gamma [Candidatus Sericytochromatia bacterium]
MASIREIKGRIKSVKNTGQITKAMQMVAAAKVRKAQERVLAARPYAEALEAMFKEVAANLGGEDIEEPLLKARAIKTVGLLVITSDKGLAGAYNSNVLRASLARINALKAEGYDVKLWLVGTKAVSFYKSLGVPVGKTYTGLPAVPTYSDAKQIVGELTRAFLTGEVDRVDVAFTRFVSMITFKVSEMTLLPVTAPLDEKAPATKGIKPAYIFEPSVQEVISAVLPRYAETQIYRALLEGAASELASRMMAMSSATKNAKEMLDRMTMIYNKARQTSITQEILEVVGGAEAMRG